MSKREVAMNSNYKFGELLCPSCNTTGPHGVLRPGHCSACKRATCFVCRGADDDARQPHYHPQFCNQKSAEASR